MEKIYWVILRSILAQLLLIITSLLAIISAMALVVGVVTSFGQENIAVHEIATDIFYLGVVGGLVLLLTALILDEDSVQMLPY